MSDDPDPYAELDDRADASELSENRRRPPERIRAPKRLVRPDLLRFSKSPPSIDQQADGFRVLRNLARDAFEDFDFLANMAKHPFRAVAGSAGHLPVLVERLAGQRDALQGVGLGHRDVPSIRGGADLFRHRPISRTQCRGTVGFGRTFRRKLLEYREFIGNQPQIILGLIRGTKRSAFPRIDDLLREVQPVGTQSGDIQGVHLHAVSIARPENLVNGDLMVRVLLILGCLGVAISMTLAIGSIVLWMGW